MTTKAHILTTITLAAPLLFAQAQTNQTTAATAPPPLSPTEQTIYDIKNPVPWLSWGGDFRVRNEYFNDALSLTSDPKLSPLFGDLHAQDYFRFRGRLWTTITPIAGEGLTLNVRLSAEPREFMEPSTFDTYYNELGTQWRYGIVDNLNVQWKQPLNLPMTLTVGRQDIFLGDGWLVGDGTPEDGSFTYFLDAVRMTYELKEYHTTLDVIGLVQDARPDGWLPTLGPSTSLGGNPEPLLLTDQNEKGAILWVANNSLPAANLDGYFMYKNDTRLNTSPEATFGDNADIYTIGGRVSGLVEDHWKYSAEGAYQFGRKQDPELNGQTGGPNPLLAPSAQTTGFRDLSAIGVNSTLSYLFKDKMDNRLTLCFEFLSGDNPNTKTDEMFDVLWGRWPSWSEMYNIYSYVQETRVGQTANLYRLGPTWTLSPTKKLGFSASYFALFCDQDVPTRDLNAALGVPTSNGPLGPYTGTGNFRGHYLQAVLRYRFSQHLTGHLWGEFLFPGDFYVDRGMMTFLRAEMMYTF